MENTLEINESLVSVIFEKKTGKVEKSLETKMVEEKRANGIMVVSVALPEGFNPAERNEPKCITWLETDLQNLGSFGYKMRLKHNYL